MSQYFPFFNILLFGFPLYFLPGSFISNIFLPIHTLSIFCPNHLDLHSLTTSLVTWGYSQREPQHLQHCHLQLCFSLLVIATIPQTINKAGVPFAVTLLSHITSDTFLHPILPACTLFFTCYSHVPFPWRVTSGTWTTAPLWPQLPLINTQHT